MPRTLNIGIIGCGRVTETFHLPSLRSLPAARVLALSDTDRGRLGRLAGIYNVANTYDDPYELINRSEIEAVAVCAPTEYHYSLGMAVLESGKHLFMEKPAALSREESGELIKKARGTPLKALVAHNLRWHRSVIKAKEIVGNGALGQVELVRSAMTVNDPGLAEWRRKRALGGGSIIDLGIHHFDLIRYLFDADADSIHAMSVSGDIEDETALVSMKWSNGIPSSSVFSYSSGHANEIEIFGGKGIMKISLYDIAGLEIRPCAIPAGRLIGGVGRAADKISQALDNSAALKHGGIFKDSYHREWESFIDSVINDREAGCSLEDGSRALEIALAAIESASTGTAVKLSSSPDELG